MTHKDFLAHQTPNRWQIGTALEVPTNRLQIAQQTFTALDPSYADSALASEVVRFFAMKPKRPTGDSGSNPDLWPTRG